MRLKSKVINRYIEEMEPKRNTRSLVPTGQDAPRSFMVGKPLDPMLAWTATTIGDSHLKELQKLGLLSKKVVRL